MSQQNVSRAADRSRQLEQLGRTHVLQFQFLLRGFSKNSCSDDRSCLVRLAVAETNAWRWAGLPATTTTATTTTTTTTSTTTYATTTTTTTATTTIPPFYGHYTGQLGTCESIFCVRIESRIESAVFRIEFSNLIGRIYHASRNTV